MLTGVHKMQRMALALTSIDQYHKDDSEFFRQIIQVTGDETWVLFVNVETKEQSKHWMQTHSPNKPDTFKQTFVRKLMAAVFWDMKVVLIVEIMQQGTTGMSEVYLRNTKQTA
jgi:hypothetical protein